jgi:uncharacterized protein (TIGR00156 family)
MKTLIAAASLASLMSASAFAAYTGPNAGPAQGGAPQQVESVKAALAAADDAPVILEGQVTKRIEKDNYEFTDGKDTIRVEIDHDKWPAGVDVSDKQRVRLVGEVDRDSNGVEVDVDQVQVLK